MKRYFIVLITAFSYISICHAQLSLEDCHRKAHANYPLIRQYDLIEQSRQFTVENISKGYYPQIELSAVATYQSDVSEIPDVNLKLFGFNIPSKWYNVSYDKLSKDQYSMMLKLSQNVYDGGAVSAQKRIARSTADVSQEQLNVGMYQVNARVDNLFFGIILLNEQIKCSDLFIHELSLNLNTLQSMNKSGFVSQYDMDVINLQLKRAAQKQESLKGARRSYFAMLGILTDQNIADSTLLIVPSDDLPGNSINRRPELQLFNANQALIDAKLHSINTNTRPKVGVFAQAGYGKPGLDIFSRSFSPYYVIGASVKWNISAFYTHKNEKRVLLNDKSMVDAQRSLFIQNCNVLTAGQQETIRDLKQKIKTDDEIIALSSSIRSKAENKMKNGSISSDELLKHINAENESRQDKALHQVMLLKEINELKYIGNN